MTAGPPAPHRCRSALLGVLLCLIAASCGVDQGVSTVGAEPTPIGAAPPPDGSAGTAVPSDIDPSTTAPERPSTPASTVPPEPTLPAIAEPELLGDVPIGDVVSVDANKPARDYDAFVGVAVSDIERWWAVIYPTIYGQALEPLAGGIYAGYPERQDPIPGCEEARSTTSTPSVTPYEDLQQFGAFYCQIGDFMAYDDGDGDASLLFSLTDAFGPAVMGVVLSHEYGHAIQARVGALDDFTATILTEQQADCFSGAWAGQAYRGESPLLRLGDADVRAGLIAMLEVRDPPGTNQFVAGGHGSAFDRVGAFQEGFADGPARCAELLDTPLQLMPNEFQQQSDFERGGNASYDCSDDPNPDCTPATQFLADDLNDFWATYLDVDFPAIKPEPVTDLESIACNDGLTVSVDAVLCPSTNTLSYDEPDVVSLYDEFGDFTLGYIYGISWAERAQMLEGSELQGEPRALLNDCYTGAWTADITPDDAGRTPRQKDADGDGFFETGISSSPGDLDEAIRMAILVGDAGANVNEIGSPFEKIESFRVGVLGGLDACRARFGA